MDDQTRHHAEDPLADEPTLSDILAGAPQPEGDTPPATGEPEGADTQDAAAQTAGEEPAAGHDRRDEPAGIAAEAQDDDLRQTVAEVRRMLEGLRDDVSQQMRVLSEAIMTVSARIDDVEQAAAPALPAVAHRGDHPTDAAAEDRDHATDPAQAPVAEQPEAQPAQADARVGSDQPESAEPVVADAGQDGPAVEGPASSQAVEEPFGELTPPSDDSAAPAEGRVDTDDPLAALEPFEQVSDETAVETQAPAESPGEPQDEDLLAALEPLGGPDVEQPGDPAADDAAQDANKQGQQQPPVAQAGADTQARDPLAALEPLEAAGAEQPAEQQPEEDPLAALEPLEAMAQNPPTAGEPAGDGAPSAEDPLAAGFDPLDSFEELNRQQADAPSAGELTPGFDPLSPIGELTLDADAAGVDAPARQPPAQPQADEPFATPARPAADRPDQDDPLSNLAPPKPEPTQQAGLNQGDEATNSADDTAPPTPFAAGAATDPLADLEASIKLPEGSPLAADSDTPATVPAEAAANEDVVTAWDRMEEEKDGPSFRVDELELDTGENATPDTPEDNQQPPRRPAGQQAAPSESLRAQPAAAQQPDSRPEPMDILYAIAEPEEIDETTEAALETAAEMREEVAETLKRSRAKIKLDAFPFDAIPKGSPLIIAVYSPSGGTGKSSTAMNLAAATALSARAVAEARQRKGEQVAVPRVAIVDGDVVRGSLLIRLMNKLKPNMHTLQLYLDEREEQGFTGPARWPSSYDDASAGEKAMREFVHWPEALPNLNLLAAPDEPDKYFDFGESEYHEILQLLGRFYDVIVIDCGTEIVMPSQRAWLSHAHQVFIVTKPEVDRLWNAQKDVYYMIKRRYHPEDNLQEGPLLPPLVTEDKIAVVMNSFDIDSGLDPEIAMERNFARVIDKRNFFYIPHLESEMTKANNSGRFLVMENTEYAKVINAMLKHTFRRYTEQQRNALPAAQ